MIIYNSTGIKKIEFEPDNSSQYSNGVMTDNVVTLSFTHFKSIALEVNDYVLFNNEKFILSEPYTPIHKNNQQYSYESIKFYGTIGDCRKALVLKMVNDSSESVFSLTAPLFDHLKLVVDNINRVKNSISWVVGAVSNNSKNETITYDGTYCIDALGKIAETFETEWWVEGYSINATKAEFGTAIELGYGKGLLGLARDANKEARFFTRLYPVGSMRNIDRTKYGHDRLQLPAGVKYVDRNIELGVIEASEEAAFAHIYPKRIGVVSESRSAPVKIDGADSIIYYFKDDKLNFDPSEYIIADQTMKIVFQSGELNGYEFEVNYKDGEFEIINQYPSPDIQLPGGTFVPKIGDEYILYNIVMPDEYYTLAENEYKQATNEYLKKYSEDVSIYKGQTDYVYLGEKELILKVGQRVKLLSNYFENGYRDSRIIKITRKLNNRLAMDLEISNSVGKTRLETVEGSVANIQTLFKEQINKNELHILRSWDSSDPSDYNVFSALRSLKVFAKLVGGNFFRGVQRFYDGLQSSDFVTGLTGKGWAILNRFGKSHIEADSLTLREFLEVPELRFNRVDVVSGELWNATAFGTIERVDTENKIATVKLLEGELLSSHVNDICRGIFYNLGSDKDSDDDNGFKQMQGFGTAYFTPTELLADGKSFRYELQNGTTFHPCKAMKFVSYGNFSDKTRQASAYSTRTYTRYLSGVNTWSINPDKHIVAQFGDIEGLTIGGVTMRGTGSFQKNMYMTGVHIQFTPEELEDLRGQDAYNVSLSSYEGVIKVAGDGTIPTMLTEKNVITGELNVISGNENVITKTFILSTRIQAFKGASELFYALTPSTGAYSITLSPINCDAVVSGGVLSVTSIEDITNAYVDLQVNCEGNAVFTKRYAVFGVSDGQDGADGTSAYVIDLDNETDSVSCDHDGVVLNPENLPTTNITVYCGSQIDTAWIFSGVFHGCKGVIRGNHVQLTELTSDKATVDITATKSGISDLKTVFTVSKIKGGADGTPATRYWLLPSVNVIKCNSSGVNSPGAIQCRKCKQVGDGPIRYEEGNMHNDTELYYDIDGREEGPFPLSNNELYVHSVKQYLNFTLKDATTGNILDSERIPVVKDGTNGGDGRPGGNGFICVYKKSENKPTAPIGTAKIPSGWQENVPSESNGIKSIIHHDVWRKDVGGNYHAPITEKLIFTKNRIEIVTTETTTIDITLSIGGSNKNKGVIGNLDSVIGESSTSFAGQLITGTKQFTVSIFTPGKHFIEIGYYKKENIENVVDTFNYKVNSSPTPIGMWWSSSSVLVSSTGLSNGEWSDPVPYKGVDVNYVLESSVTHITCNSLGTYTPSSFIVTLYGKYTDNTQLEIQAYLAVYGYNGEKWVRTVNPTIKSNCVEVKTSVLYKQYMIKAHSSADPDFNSISIASYGVNVTEDVNNSSSKSMPRNCGEYKSDKPYVYDKNYQDCVYVVEKGVSSVYRVRVFGTQLVNKKPGVDDGWELGNKEIFTAIDTALIDGADIAGFLFKNGIIQSRDSTGNVANTTINGKTGEIITRKLTAIDANITGVITATGGKISSLDIKNGGLSINEAAFNANESYFAQGCLKLNAGFIGVKSSSGYANYSSIMYAGDMPSDMNLEGGCALYIANGFQDVYKDTTAAYFDGRGNHSNTNNRFAIKAKGGIHIDLAQLQYHEKFYIHNLQDVGTFYSDGQRSHWSLLLWDKVNHHLAIAPGWDF